MNGSLLRGRLLVRIQSGSPNLPINTKLYGQSKSALCKIMQDFAAFVREQAKNIATKRLQLDQPYKDFWSSHKQKNPGSAATETGIKSKTKASSFLNHCTPRAAAEATGIQDGELLLGGAS